MPTNVERHDPELGRLVYNEEIDSWDARVSHGGRDIMISVDSRPVPLLLAHARQIARELSRFVTRVREFLEEAAVEREWRRLGYEAEIRGLEIEKIVVPWPKHPDSGTVYFRGGSHGRGWRCDFAGERVHNLSFDS